MDRSHPYFFEHGDLWFMVGNNQVHIAGPSDSLAVVYDKENGTMFKHGELSLVEKWMDNTLKKFAGKANIITDDLTLISFPVLPETVEELNICVQTSGRVMHLPEFLRELSEKIAAGTSPA